MCNNAVALVRPKILSTALSTTSINHGSYVSMPPERLLKPMNFPRKLLMGPGPINCSPRILAAGALPLLGHLHPEFTEV